MSNWQQQLERIVDEFGSDFSRFTATCSDQVKLGDKLISDFFATGYNIIPFRNHVPIVDFNTQGFSLFYNSEIDAVDENVSILHEMERFLSYHNIIINLGAKASKVLYDNWPVEDERSLGTVVRINPQGGISSCSVQSSIEMVITFDFDNTKDKEGCALTTINYLGAKSKWQVPDIRASMAFKDILSGRGFHKVNVSCHNSDRTQLLTLRKTSRVDGYSGVWEYSHLMVENAIYGFLDGFGVSG